MNYFSRGAPDSLGLAVISAKDLAQPANFHLRLQHLLTLTAGGQQRRFAQGVGIHQSSISPLVNRKQPLTPARAEQLLAGVPGLSRAWLLDGEGEAFPGGTVPVFAPVPPGKAPPRAKAGSVQGLRTRERPVQVMAGLEPWDPALTRTDRFSNKELLGNLMERVRHLKEHECGMTAAQVASVLRVLEHVF